MATRRAELKELNPDFVKHCLDGNAGQIEARMLALTRHAPHPLAVDCALALFKKFPLRFREQLGAGVAGVGVAWKHGAKASAFQKLKTPKAPNKDVPVWHEAATRALFLALSHREKPPKPGARSKTPPLPRAATRDVLQTAWLEKAKSHSPEDLAELLPRFAEGPGTHLTARALELLAFPTDARIADAAAAFIARPSVRVVPEVPVFTVLALVLAVHGDASHRAAVEALVQKIDTLAWLEAALPTKSTPRPAVVEKSSTASPKDERSFLEFIGERPTDEARIALFQDWLIERGDPRGEFMALQRAGTALTPKDTRRLAALQKKYEKTWLGSFAPAMEKGSARFVAGLPRGVSVIAWKPSDVPLHDDPVLPLLEHFSLEGGTNLPLAKVFDAPWRSLTSLHAADFIWLAMNEALLPRLTSVGIIESGADLEDRVQILSSPKLNAVRHLTLDGFAHLKVERVQAILKSRPLESLTVRTMEPAMWAALAGQVPLLRVAPERLQYSNIRLTFEFAKGKPMHVSVPDATDDRFEWEVVGNLKSFPPALRKGATLAVPYEGERLAKLRKLLR